MPFKMKVDQSASQELLPPGIYKIMLKGFKPATSKNGGSVNLNPVLEVQDDPDHIGHKLFDNLNTKAGFIHQDFSHAFGLDVEDLGNGQMSIPGDWDGDETNPSTWKYTGPLLGRTAQVEVAQSEYNGKINNKIRKYICAVPDCTERHSDDLLKNKS